MECFQEKWWGQADKNLNIINTKYLISQKRKEEWHDCGSLNFDLTWLLACDVTKYAQCEKWQQGANNWPRGHLIRDDTGTKTDKCPVLFSTRPLGCAKQPKNFDQIWLGAMAAGSLGHKVRLVQFWIFILRVDICKCYHHTNWGKFFRYFDGTSWRTLYWFQSGKDEGINVYLGYFSIWFRGGWWCLVMIDILSAIFGMGSFQ